MKHQVLLGPVITEKTLWLIEKQHVYTFQVHTDASKTQVAHAVQDTFGVKVEDVNTVFDRGTTHRTGRRRVLTMQPRIKKAFVKVAADQHIDAFDLK
jgi:large subunit ribosomal protein L23